MTDAGGGIWTVSIPSIAAGSHEFKFQADNTAWEDFNGGSYSCTVTNGDFSNRALTVNGDAALPTYCFNSCFACGEAVKITFNVGAGHIMTSPDGLFVAGGAEFGSPGDNPLADSDGDDVWTWVFERQTGFSSYYTYLNGNCPDWSCKEMIAGQACSSPDNFNDRFMGPLMADTVITTCFEECSDVTMCDAAPLRAVTFSVNMNNWTEMFTQPYLSGSFNGWSGDANPMEDADMDGIWTTTLMLVDGDFQYKFQMDNWTTDEVLTDGDPCTITDGGFTNRLISVDGDASVCFEFRSCTECGGTGGDPGNVTLEVNMSSYTDMFTTVYLAGSFNGWDGEANPMEDPDGDGIWTTTLMLPAGNNEYKFTLDNWAVQEEFAGGESCTITDPSGQFVNRLIVVDGDASECWTWNACADCAVNADDLTIDANLFKVNPTLANEFTRLTFNENVEGDKTILVHDLMGKVLYRAEVDATNLQHDISVSGWTNGLYLITVQTENLIASKKITKF